MKNVLSVIIISLLLFSLNIEANPNKLKKTSKSANTKILNKSKKISSKSSKNLKKSKKSKKRRIRDARAVNVKNIFQLLKDSTLAKGIVYKKYQMGTSKANIGINCTEVDISDKQNLIKILKANKNINELEKLVNIVNNYDSTEKIDILTAVNANFWQAYTNYPIGPTIINGEIIELSTHKNWTSGFFDEKNQLYIDNYRLTGKISFKSNQYFEISSVNHRNNPSDMVIYNHYAGDTIPYISTKQIEKSLEEYLEYLYLFNDSTELEIDTAKYRQELLDSKRDEKIENSHLKVSLLYLDKPAVNQEVRCKVLSLDFGAVAVPKGGCLLSLEKDFKNENYFKKGDTIKISFSTNVNSDKKFLNSVSGTPRLVRDGSAKSEAANEGVRKGRFLNCALPRTAIGIDKSMKKLLIVVVEPCAKAQRRYGASLAQLSVIMKRLGAYNAMNLDGGGSSTFVINKENLQYPAFPYSGRRISIGLGVYRDKKR
jgi:hypothetical protein